MGSTEYRNAGLFMIALTCAGMLTVASAGGSAAAAEATAAGNDQARASAADLVRQLGGDDYKAREAAQKALVRMGADALEAVRSGAGSTDEETRSRCQAILTEIHRNLKAARTEAIARSVAWKLPVDAAPTDSVVVAGSLLLFVDQDDVLHAADAATGKEKWKADERIGRFAPVGPAVDGQTAYAVCFDHETFKWSVVALRAGGRQDPVALAGQGERLSAGRGRRRGVRAQLREGPARGCRTAPHATVSAAHFRARPGLRSPGRQERPEPLELVRRRRASPPGDRQKAGLRGRQRPEGSRRGPGARREAWVSEEFKDPPQFRVRGYSPQGLLVDGDKVIVLATATLSALAAQSGKTQWALDMPNDYLRTVNDLKLRRLE